MHDSNKTIKTLEEALQKQCKNRDMDLARQAMENYSSTPGKCNEQPLSFWASWDLKDRPRRIALLLDDCQEEYRPYASKILPNIKKLVNAFRHARANSDGTCIMWSAWTRTFDDGISNSMDRWYGPKGFRAEGPNNAVYIFKGTPGIKTLAEIAPTENEIADGWFYHGKHLDMFWNFDEQGDSYLDKKLKSVGIDTIVLVGLWTDECILSTSYAAYSRGYDVVVVGDSVATATSNHEIALKVAGGTVAKVVLASDVLNYMKNDFVCGELGVVKGTLFPDGRKDD
jgi:nicotinamidase-related amidase